MNTMKHWNMHLITLAAVLAITTLAAAPALAAPPMKALLVTGQNNHDWRLSAPILKTILEDGGLFAVDMATTPEGADGMDQFQPDFAAYDVVVLDYNGENWPESTRAAFLEYVRNGGGVVVYHAANNAFGDWPAFNELIGLGGWGGRTEASGPYLRWRDGAIARDAVPGPSGNHGAQHAFQVTHRNTEHPITRGLPEVWKHAKDELYSELRGPGNNLTLLATAYSDPKTRGTGEHEPILFTVHYGQGRVFQTALGHAGGENPPPAMQCVGFIVTLRRGAEWAATGDVTQPVPDDFPTADAVRLRPNFREKRSAEALLRGIAAYEYGDSLEAQVAMDTLVREALAAKAPLHELEQQFIALLQSDATLPAKQYACMKLGEIGGPAALPALAKMLRQPETSDMARLALQRIPGDSATEILLDALPALSGPHRIGVIATLGERGDARAASSLESLMNGASSEEAMAIIAALGRIADDNAAAALQKIRAEAHSEWRQAVSDALLQCAGNFLGQNKARKATAIYEQLDSPDESAPIRAAALRGRIVSARGARAANIILDVLRAGSPEMQAVAAAAVREIESDKAIESIAAKLSELDPAVQCKLIAALADRDAVSAQPHILMAAESADPEVRVAALRALAAIGNADAVLPLAAWAASADATDARTARDSLARMRSKDVDAAIVTAIPKADPPVRTELIGAAGARGIAAAAQALLAAAKDAETPVRAAAHEALRAAATPEILPSLVALLTESTDPEAAKQTQESIAAIATKIPDEKERPAAVLAALGASADEAVKVRLIGALGHIGADAGLTAIRETLQANQPALNMAVIEALSMWPNDAPISDLAALAEKYQRAAEGAPALSGFIRLIGLNAERPAEDSVALYEKALGLAASAEQKESALTGLGATKAAAALPVLYSALEAPEEPLRNAAIRALSDWPDPAPMESLGNLARSAAGAPQGALALGGYVRLVGLPNACSPEDAARRYEEAMQLAANDGQKKMVLGALANTSNIAALRMAAAYLQDPALKAEAEAAAVKIAATVCGAYPQETKTLLTPLRESAENDFVKQEAEKILAQLARFEEYITAWMAAGPYAAEGVAHAALFDMPFAPEQDAPDIAWQLTPAGTNAAHPYLIELDKFYGGDNRAAYLRSYIWSDAARGAVLELGSDDGIKVWLNGEVVHANNATRPCVPNQDKAPVALPAGWSALLVKVTQGGGEWSFCARLRAPEGEKLDGWRAAHSPK